MLVLVLMLVLVVALAIAVAVVVVVVVVVVAAAAVAVAVAAGVEGGISIATSSSLLSWCFKVSRFGAQASARRSPPFLRRRVRGWMKAYVSAHSSNQRPRDRESRQGIPLPKDWLETWPRNSNPLIFKGSLV